MKMSDMEMKRVKRHLKEVFGVSGEEVVDGRVERRMVGEGKRVIVKGDPAYDYYMLVKGQVSVFDEQDHKILKYTEKPIGLGELGLLFNIPRTSTVTADTDCTFYTVPSTIFHSITSEFQSRLQFLKQLKLFETMSPHELF